MEGLVRLIKELGPVWGPPVGLVFLACWWLKHRSDTGHHGVGLIVDHWVPLAFLVAIVVLAGWEYYYYRYWGVPSAFGKGEIGILITELPGDANRQQQAAYAREIYALVQKTPDLAAVVKVKMLRRALPSDPQEQHAEALKWGRRVKAKFVLRPNAVEGIQAPWITVVDQPEFARVEAPMGKFANAQLANLDQLPLPSDLLLLARCALALAFYRQGAYDRVADEVQDVLAAQGLPHRGHT